MRFIAFIRVEVVEEIKTPKGVQNVNTQQRICVIGEAESSEAFSKFVGEKFPGFVKSEGMYQLHDFVMASKKEG